MYKNLGVSKGDRVVLYMPMIPEAAYAMLACARIGAIHSIVFAGFSPEALAARVEGCKASLIVTADEAPRGGKNTPLKANVDKALEICGDVKNSRSRKNWRECINERWPRYIFQCSNEGGVRKM